MPGRKGGERRRVFWGGCFIIFRWEERGKGRSSIRSIRGLGEKIGRAAREEKERRMKTLPATIGLSLKGESIGEERARGSYKILEKRRKRDDIRRGGARGSFRILLRRRRGIIPYVEGTAYRRGRRRGEVSRISFWLERGGISMGGGKETGSVAERSCRGARSTSSGHR